MWSYRCATESSHFPPQPISAHACTRRAVAWLGSKSILLTAMTSRGASLCSCACAVAQQDQSVCNSKNHAQPTTTLRLHILVLLLHIWRQAQSATSAGLPCSRQALQLLAQRCECKACGARRWPGLFDISRHTAMPTTREEVHSLGVCARRLGGVRAGPCAAASHQSLQHRSHTARQSAGSAAAPACAPRAWPGRNPAAQLLPSRSLSACAPPYAHSSAQLGRSGAMLQQRSC